MHSDPYASLIMLLITVSLVARLARSTRRTNRPEKKQHSATPAPAAPDDLERAVSSGEGQPPTLEHCVLVHRLSQRRAQEGRLVEAEALAQKVSGRVRELSQTSREDMIAAWGHHVSLLRALGRTEEAEELQRRVVDLAERAHLPGAVAIAHQHAVLAAIVARRGRMDEAASLLRKASGASGVLSAAPSECASVSALLGGIAEGWFVLGNLSEAEHALASKLEVDRQLLGEANTMLAPTLEALANVRRAHGRLHDASRDLAQALALIETGNRPLLCEASRLAHDLGTLHYELGDLAAAERFLARSLGMREHLVGRDCGGLAQAVRQLAEIQRLRGHTGDAEASLRRALALQERVIGGEHPDLVSCLLELANLLAGDLRYAEAEEFLRRAVAIARRQGSADYRQRSNALDALARFEIGRGADAEAEALFSESLRAREQLLGKDHPEIAFRLTDLAELQRGRGRVGGEEAGLGRALAILKSTFGPDHLQLAGVLQRLAALCFERTDLEAAIRRMQEALDLADTALGTDDPGVLPVLDNLVRLLDHAGRRAEADHGRARAQLLRTARRASPILN